MRANVSTTSRTLRVRIAIGISSAAQVAEQIGAAVGQRGPRDRRRARGAA